jgi:hypothetical protein
MEGVMNRWGLKSADAHIVALAEQGVQPEADERGTWVALIRWAHVASGVVTNVVEQDVQPQLDGEWVECPEWVGAGCGYSNGEFTAPQPPDAPPRYLTRLAFISRFSDAEAITIDLASIGATQQAAAMRRYQNKVSAATYIDPQRADTRAGVLALEAAGVLAAGRGLEILDAPITDAEHYRGA